MPVEPSASGAVFLSYASQDAAAAKRIADALRAADVEVWFDQSELVGGDAWDAKIRGQISSCALFVPLISANTQARREGYFRIEWKLAAQRTHAMADGTPFLLPLLIDGTRDAEALVPAEFRAVQWTRLPAGETPEKFCERVKKLLGGESASVVTGVTDPGPASTRPAAPKSSRPWLVPAMLGGAALVALAIWRPWEKGEATTASAPAPAVAASPADELVARARALLDDDPLMTRANVVLAEQLSLQAIAKDPTSAEAHAVAAWANFRYLEGNYEDTPQRRADLRTYAEKARLLAPDSISAELAMAGVLLATNNRPEAVVRLRALADRAPGNLTVLRAYAGATPWGDGVNWGDDEKSDPAALARLRAHSALGRAYADSLLANQHWAKGEYVEAERVLDAVWAAGHPVRLTYLLRLLLLTYGWGDLPAARDFSATLPAKLLLEDVFITHVTNVWLYSGDHDNALATLDRTQREMLQEAKIMIPTALFRGEVLAAAGRPAAATIQWRTALGLVDKLLAGSPDNPMLHLHRMNLLIRLGNREGAAAEFGVVMEITHPVAGSVSWGRGYEYYALIGEVENAIPRIDRLIARDNGRWPNDYNNLRYEPALAGLRKDPRVQAIMARGAGWLAEMRRGATSEQPQAGLPPLPDNKSVAVLAFANLSDDKSNEYFSDGISEELLNVLAKVPGLKVTARTSSFHFKGKDTPIPDIAQQLGVAYVVEGSVRKQGDKVRITAQLIKAADGFHVWSDTFTRDLKDIFAVQDEIAGLIAKNLQLKMGAGTYAKDKATDVAAWQLYLDGRRAWNLRTIEGYREAEALFQRAIDLDAQFARAYAALADVWHNRAIDEGGGTFSPRWRTSPTAIQSHTLIDKAIAIDPRCAEAYASLGMNLQLGWQDEPALQAYRRAIELNPNYATAHQWLGLALLGMGEMDETLSEVKQAAELDPLSHRILSDYANVLNWVGRPKEALAVSRRALVIQPGEVQAVLQEARALALLGRPLEAVALIEGTGKRGLSTRMRGEALSILVVAKQPEAIRRLMGNVDAMPASTLKFAGLVAMGRIDAAFADFESSPAWNGWGLVEAAFGSLYEPIRGDGRFQKMIETSGRAEYFYRAQAWRAAHPPERPAAK